MPYQFPRAFCSNIGKVTEFFSDNGTNFVGSTDALNQHRISNPEEVYGEKCL